MSEIDAQAAGLAEHLLAWLNGEPQALAAQCRSPSPTIHCRLLSDRRAPTLTDLVAVFRSKYPGITFDLERTTPTDDGFLVACSGRFESPLGGGRVVRAPCQIRVRRKHDKIEEMWFDADEHEILLQLGRICCAPGESCEPSVAANRRGADLIVDAIRGRQSLLGALGPGVALHASVQLFTDIRRGIETQLWEIEGVDKLDELVSLVHAHFSDPIELSLDAGISQGFTTTFRGSIRGTIAGVRQRYVLCIGVRSPGERIAESWVKIAPPLALKECLT